jgi:hypothetical protein
MVLGASLPSHQQGLRHLSLLGFQKKQGVQTGLLLLSKFAQGQVCAFAFVQTLFTHLHQQVSRAEEQFRE